MINEENNKSEDSAGQTMSYEDIPKKSDKNSFPLIAGILMIIAGIIAIIYALILITMDINTFSSFVDINQLKSIDPNITIEKVKELFNLCFGIVIIISVFTILGGILSFRKKLWGMALACSIIGLFSFGIMFMSSILCFIALILITLSKKEFQ